MRVLVIALLALTTLAFAEVQMTVDQLRAFITSSKQLGHTDKQVADYMRGVKMKEKLEPGVIEDLTGTAGPRTMEVLRRLGETSKSLQAPPPPPPKVEVQQIPPPSSEEQGRILDRVRDYALDYSKRLPNFICTQVTRRYGDPSGLEFWQQQDTITAKLSYFEQKEDYKVMLVNNQYVKDMSMERLGGATSSGEFGSLMKEVFELDSQTTFDWERWATLRGRRMYVFSYFVKQENSKWSIMYERKEQIRPSYGGLVYVDRDTNVVMRVTLDARNIPVSFPVQQATTTLDYDYQTIAGTPYVLPLKAVIRMRAGKMLSRNESDFRMYNRFGAEATITFEPDPIPDDQLKEQGAGAPEKTPEKPAPDSAKKKKKK